MWHLDALVGKHHDAVAGRPGGAVARAARRSKRPAFQRDGGLHRPELELQQPLAQPVDALLVGQRHGLSLSRRRRPARGGGTARPARPAPDRPRVPRRGCAASPAPRGRAAAPAPRPAGPCPRSGRRRRAAAPRGPAPRRAPPRAGLAEVQREGEAVDALVGVLVAAGIGAGVAAAPGHARAAQQRRLPDRAVHAVAVAVAGDHAEVEAADPEPGPAEERPLAGRRLAVDLAVGDAVGPALGRRGQHHRHLQERVALVEVHLEIQVQRRLAAAEADGQADAGAAEPAVEPGAHPQRAGFLDPPVRARQRRRHRLLPAVGVEGPGVGAVLAQMQAAGCR